MRKVLPFLAMVLAPPTLAVAGLGPPDQFWHQDSPGILDAAENDDIFARSLASGDFNGDGYRDLAVGVANDDLGAFADAGLVHVLYGSTQGLAEAGNQLWTQDSPGILDSAEDGDQFGYTLAGGDFNGDGFTDLAVGVYAEDVGAIADAGAVAVLYGSASGLTEVGDQLWHQDVADVDGAAETEDLFGLALATGNFNGDLFADLAIGVPLEDIGAIADAGAVNVLYGSPSGLAADGDQLWHQDVAGVPDAAEADDRFGSALAAGDFDNSGHGDLAIGVFWEDVGAIVDAGAVTVLYGTDLGLREFDAEFWHQDVGAVQGSAEEGDRFGESMVGGFFNGDGASDLAVGVPYEDVNAGTDAGAVNVLYGDDLDGLTDAGNQIWHQDSTGILEIAEDDDFFGAALAVGDFEDNFVQELVIGAGQEDLGALLNPGVVQVLYADPVSGLGAAGNQLFSQDTAEMSDGAEETDVFGNALAAGDFDGDGFDELAVGAAGEDLEPIVNAGALHVLPATLVFADGFESGDTAAWDTTVP